MLILSDEDVRGSITMKDAIDLQRVAFINESEGKATVPPRTVIQNEKGPTLFKPCSIGGEAAALGIKVVSVRPNNVLKGQPTVPGVVLLIDKLTGMPEAILNGTYLTALRTGAGSGVATSLLASEDSETLLIFGAGIQARAHIEAVCCIRKIRKLCIVNRTKSRACHLAEEMHGKFSSLDSVDAVALSDTDSVREWCAIADVVCTTTNSSKPLFKGEWLKSGCHLNAIGSYTPEEIDLTTVKRSAILVDTENAVHTSGDICIPMQMRQLAVSQLFGTIGELLTGRTSEQYKGASAGNVCDITLFKSIGTASQDIATAQAVLESAKISNRGTSVAL